MNTQATVLTFEDGQAVQLPRRMAGPVVLTEGEVLVQAPAKWLAGRLVLPAPHRLTAPAVLDIGPTDAVKAVHASKVLVGRAPATPLPLARPSTARWFQVLLHR